MEIRGKQIKLGPDKDQAFKNYYKLMAEPEQFAQNSHAHKSSDPLIAELCDFFLEWVERNRAPDTYEWYRYRLQRFVDRYPEMRSSDLKPYHVER